MTPQPCYAGEGCEDGCDMEVDITVSGDSEVAVSTGEHSEVEVLPGPYNNVYINGQDINEPTVINHYKKQTNYNMGYSRRITALENWEHQFKEGLQIVADGLAQLIIKDNYDQEDVDTLQLQQDLLKSELTTLQIEMYDRTDDVSAFVDVKVFELSSRTDGLQTQINELQNELLWYRKVGLWCGGIGILISVVIGSILLNHLRSHKRMRNSNV